MDIESSPPSTRSKNSLDLGSRPSLGSTGTHHRSSKEDFSDASNATNSRAVKVDTLTQSLELKSNPRAPEKVIKDHEAEVASARTSAPRISPTQRGAGSARHSASACSTEHPNLDHLGLLKMLSLLRATNPNFVGRRCNPPHRRAISARVTSSANLAWTLLADPLRGSILQLPHLQRRISPKKRRCLKHASPIAALPAFSAKAMPAISAPSPSHHVTSDRIRVHSCLSSLLRPCTGYVTEEGSFDRSKPRATCQKTRPSTFLVLLRPMVPPDGIAHVF